MYPNPNFRLNNNINKFINKNLTILKKIIINKSQQILMKRMKKKKN